MLPILLYKKKLDTGAECLISTAKEKEALVLLSENCQSKAIIDTACMDNVSGQDWMEGYIKSLDRQQREKVERKPGTRVFKFGGGERLTSKEEIIIPAYIANQEVMFKVDTVESSIPLLLSLDTLKLAETTLDTKNNIAVMAGEIIKLVRSTSPTSGHYTISLQESKESATAFVTKTLDKKDDWEAALKKLHEQYAHPLHNRLKQLIVSAGKWKEPMEKILKKIEEKCTAKICELPRKQTRPVVAFPRTNAFNQLLTLDLKIRHKKKSILYMIDDFTKLTLGELIPNKKAETVAGVVVRRWVGSGYGRPRGIHTDGGGEFTGKDLINVAENLNCTLTVTAGCTPYQNGVNERNHAVADHMLESILEDNPTMPEDIALYWACNAKNSLQMHSGFSSYQLVFGTNP